MPNPYYEAHITCSEEPKDFPAYWKLSKISGDPDLGSGDRWYLTNHYGGIQRAARETDAVAFKLGRTVVRQKIELVVMDTKNGTWDP